MFEQAARFDPSLIKLVIKLSANGSERFSDLEMRLEFFGRG